MSPKSSVLQAASFDSDALMSYSASDAHLASACVGSHIAVPGFPDAPGQMLDHRADLDAARRLCRPQDRRDGQAKPA